MDILAGFDRQAARAAGVKPTTYVEWEKAHEVYFGKTRFRRQQANAVRVARQTGKSLGPDPRKVDTSGVSYAALVSVADVSASKVSGATRLHQECRLRVL